MKRLIVAILIVSSLIVPGLTSSGNVAQAQQIQNPSYQIDFWADWTKRQWSGSTSEGSVLVEEEDASGQRLDNISPSFQSATRKIKATFTGSSAQLTSTWSAPCGLVAFGLHRLDAWTEVWIYNSVPLYQKGATEGWIPANRGSYPTRLGGYSSGTITFHQDKTAPACASFSWSLPAHEAQPQIAWADGSRWLNQIAGRGFLQDGVEDDNHVVVFESLTTRRIITRAELVRANGDWKNQLIEFPNRHLFGDIALDMGELFVRVGSHESPHVRVRIVNGLMEPTEVR